MSGKMECPGCGTVSSSVLIPVSNGEPCPFCGLSADAILEIRSVRRKVADEDLKERLEKALVELDHARTEAVRFRCVIHDARQALGCQFPYKPHDALNPET